MALEDLTLTRVQSYKDVEDMMSWLGNRRDFLAFDVETEGLNVGRDRIRLIQFGDATHGWALGYGDWRGVAREIFENYTGKMVAHNLLFDSKMLKMDGVHVPQKLAHDTMIMSFLKDPALRMDLKGACVRWIDRRSAWGQGALSEAFHGGHWTWSTIPLDHPAYWMYSAFDTCLTAMLADKIFTETGAPGAPYHRAYEIEVGAIHCLRDAEVQGLLTDPVYRLRASAKLEAELEELRPQLPLENPNADKQVIKMLERMGAHLTVRTEKGNLSVDKFVLRSLAEQFPVCVPLEKYRSRFRMLNNYFHKMDELAVNDVLYASTKPVGAFTGRMSVTDPPLQTLPRGRVVRDSIIAREGHALILADYKAMEMRALASLAQEESMLAAFNRGEDLHDFVARELYGEHFTKPQRTLCKNGGFAKVYGAGLEKFAVTAAVTVPEASAFLSMYDSMFPGVVRFMQETTNEVMERAGGRRNGRGYVELVDGRRLPVPGDESYKGVNYRIQGSCAVSVKEKMVELDAVGLGPYFRLAVHDELIYEVPLEHAERAKQLIAATMPDRHNFAGVVLEVDTDIVNRWGSHYRDDFPSYIETEDDAWLRAA